MIQITTNIKQVSERLLKKLYAVSAELNLDKMEREIAFVTAGNMGDRIHRKGLDSSGSQIGTYSPAYLRERQRKTKRHPPRTSDPKVILSLTRSMEHDFTAGVDNPEPTKTATGYGIGFKNNKNFEKSQWCEATYKKPIYNLTNTEKDKVRLIAEDFIHRSIQRI